MKLRDYIIVGYILSFLITIMAVFWASNLMLIEKKDTYFIVVITIIAGLIGATISIILLKGVFKSLRVLKRQTISISEKNFDISNTVEGPTEFRELSLSFNEMAKHLKESFESLEESEKEKSLMIAQLSHDIKTPITSIQSTAEGMLDGIIKEEEFKYYLETICRQTTRLNKLVEELNYLTLSVKDTSEDDKNKKIFSFLVVLVHAFFNEGVQGGEDLLGDGAGLSGTNGGMADGSHGDNFVFRPGQKGLFGF